MNIEALRARHKLYPPGISHEYRLKIEVIADGWALHDASGYLTWTEKRDEVDELLRMERADPGSVRHLITGKSPLQIYASYLQRRQQLTGMPHQRAERAQVRLSDLDIEAP